MHMGASNPAHINHRYMSVRGQVAESRWRAIAAAGLRARGEECAAWRGAHMGASIVVELSWVYELRLRGDGGKKN